MFEKSDKLFIQIEFSKEKLIREKRVTLLE